MNYCDISKIALEHINSKENGEKELFMLLQNIDSSFEPALSSYVNIEEYSSKLYANAYVCIVKYNEEFAGLYAIYLNSEKDKIAYLTLIGVLNEFKGSGLSQVLLDDMINLAQNRNMKTIKLEVKSSYDRAINFYKKNGFESCDKENENNNSFYMIKNL